MFGPREEIERRVESAEKLGRPEVRPWREFPIELLQWPVGRFVREGAEALGCDAAMIALPALAMLGASIGLSRRAKLKSTWHAPPTLWTAVVAESGTLKSPAQEIALRPLMKIQQEAMAEHCREKEHHEIELELWNQTPKKDRGAKPETPNARRYIVSDVTTEALAPILEANHRGILLASDELASWIGAFDRYAGGRGADAPRWLSLHRAAPLVVDRKTTGTTYVPRAAVSVTGGIQPGIAARLFSEELVESGLVARLLLAAPPTMPKRWTTREMGGETSAEMEALVRRLVALGMEPGGEKEIWPRPVDLPLARDACKVWSTWYDRHAARMSETEGPLAAALSKLEETGARFALIFALAGSPDPAALKEIPPGAVESGTKLADWFADEAERIYAMFNETPEAKDQRIDLEYIRARGGRIRVREFQMGRRKYRRSAEIAEQKLNHYVAMGALVIEHVGPGEKGGRATVEYCIPDRLTGGNGCRTPENAEKTEDVLPLPPMDTQENASPQLPVEPESGTSGIPEPAEAVLLQTDDEELDL